jgi:hypothetical protein
LMQAEFVTQVLEACQKRHLHTAIETSIWTSSTWIRADTRRSPVCRMCWSWTI